MDNDRYDENMCFGASPLPRLKATWVEKEKDLLIVLEYCNEDVAESRKPTKPPVLSPRQASAMLPQ
jgi:hypothetical protein